MFFQFGLTVYYVWTKVLLIFYDFVVKYKFREEDFNVNVKQLLSFIAIYNQFQADSY